MTSVSSEFAYRKLSATPLTSSGCQAVIFDCDGVLVDSERLIVSLLVEMTNDLDGQLDIVQGDVLFHGVHLAGCLDRINQHLGRPVPVDFELIYEQRVAALMRSQLKSLRGAEQVVSALQVPVCVASNSSLAKVRLMLETTGLLRFFGERIFSATEVGRCKPAPDVYLHAAKALKLPAARCIAVEDSEVGVRSAAAANMPVIGLASPDRAPALRAAGATVVCPTMTEVGRVLHAALTKP